MSIEFQVRCDVGRQHCRNAYAPIGISLSYTEKTAAAAVGNLIRNRSLHTTLNG